MNGRVCKWILLTTVLLAAILVPFALFGDAIDTWVNAFIERSRNRPLAASLVLGGLLAGDILLPTPSSILSTACGALLGLPLGTAVSLAGMTLSAVAGYGVGRLGQRQVIERWIGAESAARLQRVASRYGAWTVVITRPVPILAEATTVFAGLARYPFAPFLGQSLLANLGISALYAAVGARSSSSAGLLWALLAALALPGAAMLVARIVTRTRATHLDAESADH